VPLIVEFDETEGCGEGEEEEHGVEEDEAGDAQPADILGKLSEVLARGSSRLTT